MALSLTCACGARFEVEDTLAGQDVVCPECQQTNKAPSLRQPAQRTSDLALASAVLALVGAFTVLGTVAAVVLGSISLVRIRRGDERVGGAGFAIFGVAAGTILTVLTLFALSSTELFGLGGRLRRNMLGDRVDTAGELTYEDKVAGFRIIRPSREWGISDVDRLEDPFVALLQGQAPLKQKPNLLLVQTQRPVCVDVRVESRPVGTVEEMMDEVVRELTAPAPERDPWNPPLTRTDNGGVIRIKTVNSASSSKRLEAGDGIEALEKEVTIHCNVQKWKMLVRVYYTGNKLYVVRAYGQHSHFAYGEKDVRKLLDSFTILDGK